MFKTLILAISLCTCYGGIFDFIDFDSAIPHIWNDRHTNKQTKCSAKLEDGTIVEGVCKTRNECSKTNGAPSGRCGILSTCCTYERSCGRTVSSKVSYFTSGGIASQNALCSYHVQLLNNDICQIRLDFIDFETANAEQKIFDNDKMAYKCVQDNFYTTPGKGIPSICGYNKGQHIYMHLSRGSSNVSLHMKITPRTTNLPRWNIKVTQLECKKNALTSGKKIADDTPLLAPLGCLQYFTEVFGNFKSFGFDETSTTNVYVANQFYSICFKRNADTCGVTYTLKYFNLEYDTTSINEIFDASCTKDHLFVPGVLTSDLRIAKLCGPMQISSNALSISSIAPGPLYVYFYSREYKDVTPYTGGFDIDYELQSC